MSTFRDAIGQAIDAADKRGELDSLYDVCGVVLAMPEMEAIRNFLEWFGHRHGSRDDMRYVLMANAMLPKNVVEWVMSHAFPEGAGDE